MSATRKGTVVVVMLTHRDPPLVNRLVRRVIEGDDAAVVVHHDPRGPELDLPTSPQVLRVPSPLRSSWGRMGLALAVVESVAFASRVVPEMRWALVVSGQDYPCRAMSSIESELAASAYDAYLRWFPVGAPGDDVVPWQALARDRYLHRLRVPGSRRHVPFARLHPFRPKPLGTGVGLHIGDMWCNLSARAIAHVLEQRLRLRRVERYLGRCQIPDEALLPTLLLNGDSSLSIRNDRKRFIRWAPGALHPETLTEDDAADIEASTDFFARKVDSGRSGALLDRLDAAASARSMSQPRPT